MDMFNITQIQPEDVLVPRDPLEVMGTLASGKEPADLKHLEDAARRFEGLFVHQILKQMKEATAELEPESDEEDTLGESSGEHIKSMFWTFMADVVTEQGGFGLWEKIYKQLASQADAAQTGKPMKLDEQI